MNKNKSKGHGSCPDNWIALAILKSKHIELLDIKNNKKKLTALQHKVSHLASL